MARFKLLPRYRRPSRGELRSISQASPNNHLRIVRDPMWPLKFAGRKPERRADHYSLPMRLVRFLRRLFR
jgi:hypothetical protein